MANLIYMNEETALEWSSTATNTLTLTSLATDAGRQGQLHDFGVAARSRLFAYRAWVKFNTAPVVGDRVDLYIKTSDGTHPDNDDGTGDAAVSAEDKLRNLHPIGSIIVDEASITPEMVRSGTIEISARHAAPVFFNKAADILGATATEHGFTLTPVPDEIQ